MNLKVTMRVLNYIDKTCLYRPIRPICVILQKTQAHVSDEQQQDESTKQLQIPKELDPETPEQSGSNPHTHFKHVKLLSDERVTDMCDRKLEPKHANPFAKPNNIEEHLPTVATKPKNFGQSHWHIFNVQNLWKQGISFENNPIEY